MTLPASGAISFNNINVELGVAGTTQASLGQTSYRTLAGVPSGQISMSNFYGKANQFAFTISANQTNANLRTLAINAGWNQSAKLIATINSGVYISSNSTGTPALTVNGSFPGGVELTNNGLIIGMGGAGGTGASYIGAGSAGGGGGLALSVSSAITIRNNNTIAGGGGGGGGGQSGRGGYPTISNEAGGGGGGGRSSAAANSGGGARGTGNSGNMAAAAGQAGTVSAKGSGGSGSYSTVCCGARGNGGSGGGGGEWGAGGSSGFTCYSPTSNFVNTTGPYGGGAGGGAVSGNGNISWAATGTRLGGIS